MQIHTTLLCTNEKSLSSIDGDAGGQSGEDNALYQQLIHNIYQHKAEKERSLISGQIQVNSDR